LFLVSSFESIYYLTGAGFEPLERPFFLLVFPDQAKSPVLLVPKLDTEHMAKARAVHDIRSYWEYPAPAGRGWPDRLRELIGRSRRIGIEPTLRQEIVKELAGHAVECLPLVEGLRLIKSPTEVALIRRAAGYADFGVGELLAASSYGATVAGGFARTGVVMRKIMEEVTDWEILTTKVLMATWAAPRSAQPHSIPDLKGDRLGEGPHVALVLTRVNGYAAESERTFFTAPPAGEMQQAFRAMREARHRAFAMIRPGLPCGDLDRSINDFLRGEGYAGEDQRLHRTGHGIGLGNHECPWIADGSADVLAENMVISIEPGIYLRGEHSGGYRHSDTVLVTGEGCEVLTRQPSDLETLTIRG
jgi:Xaa-Pro dipeptidase